MRHALHAGFWFAAAALLSGCGGYHMGSLVPSDIRTVHVEVFDNATFRRELELGLTEAVQQEIRRRTHLRMADRATADSVLTGEIVDFRQRTEARGVEDEILTQDVTVFVDIRWTDRRTGRVLAEAAGLKRPVRLLCPRSETVRGGAFESFRFLAEIIVDQMEGGW